MNRIVKISVLVALAIFICSAAAYDADADPVNSGGITIDSVEYDPYTSMLSVSGTSVAESVFGQVTCPDGSKEPYFVADVHNGAYSKEVSLKDMPEGTYSILMFTSATDTAERTFEVSNIKVTIEPVLDNVSLIVGQELEVSFVITGTTGDKLDVRTNDDTKILIKSKVSQEGSVTIKGISEGSCKLIVGNKDVASSVDITVNPAPLPPAPTETKEFTFSMKMGMDWDKANWGTSSFSETDLRDGITLKGTGTNAGEALENACNANGIPNEFISTHDGNNNDLRYWVIQIFGLGTVAMEDGDWKYWIQEHDGTYNQQTLGWYTDNSGTYSLTYGITSVDYGNEVQSIYVKTQPTKTEYEVGESFDPAGMVVMAKMSVGEDLQIHKYTVSPSKFSQPGDQKVTLTYRDKTATVNVKVTGDAIPVIPPITPDIPIEDEKTETHTEHDDKGNTTTTTTTTGKTQDGKDVEISEVVVSKTDGSSEGTKTQTVTGKDGSVSETVTVTDKDKDGNVKETVTGTSTDNEGNVTKTESESKLDKDGNGKTVSTTTVTGKDGSTMTKSSTSEKSKDGTETEETVVAQSKDGNVRTETTSKVGTDGKVEAESKTTVKADAGKEVGADTIEGALKQSEVTLANVSADKKDVKKVVELEVSNGTSAALSPEAVKKVSDYGAGLKVSGKEGSIDTDSDVLKNLAKDGKTVELSMEANNKEVLKDKQKDIVGDNHFVDLNALVGGENVHQLGGKAVITFGYQLKDGESAVDLKVFYVDDEGNKTLVDATFSDGSFTMTVDHFSVYMVENTAAPAPVDPDTPDEDKDKGGISPVLIAGILVVIIAAIVGVVLYTRKN